MLSWYQGYDELVWNHISARLDDDESQFLVTPGDLHFDEVTPESLVVSSADDNVNITSDVIHSAIYSARPDVGAIVHHHTPAVVAVSAMANGLEFITQDSAAFYGKVCYHPWEGLSDDHEECSRLAAAVADGAHTVMLQNHGALTLGATVGEAWVRYYYLDRVCQVQCSAAGQSLIRPSAETLEHAARQYDPIDGDFRHGVYEWPSLMRLAHRLSAQQRAAAGGASALSLPSRRPSASSLPSVGRSMLGGAATGRALSTTASRAKSSLPTAARGKRALSTRALSTALEELPVDAPSPVDDDILGGKLAGVHIDKAAAMLELHGLVDDGVVSRFPFVFLRDNCTCPECFHSKSSSRLTSFSGLDMNDSVVRATPTLAQVRDTRLGRAAPAPAPAPGEGIETECLHLDWASGHTSVFALDWLRERCFSSVQQRRRTATMDVFSLVESTGAASEIGGGAAVRATASPIAAGRREYQVRTLPRFKFSELQTSSSAMLGWCHALEKYGVAVVETDNAAGVLKDFTSLFGFREWCSYGEFYVVENKQSVAPSPSIADGGAAAAAAGTEGGEEANNLAYTGLPLAFHTDLPHYASPPQVQLLHCISQTSCPGGANKLVDGFAVAEELREHHPDAFKLLTSVRMEYKDFHTEVIWDAGPGGDSASDGGSVGGSASEESAAEKYGTPRLGSRREVDFFLRHDHPIISLEDDPREWRSSRICRINFSDHHRDSVLNNLSPEQVQEYYHACKLFDALLNDERHVLWNKSRAGDILCFDNRRMLHGRAGFELTDGETRKLIGTYLRWDEIRSMARVKAARIFPDQLL